MGQNDPGCNNPEPNNKIVRTTMKWHRLFYWISYLIYHLLQWRIGLLIMLLKKDGTEKESSAALKGSHKHVGNWSRFTEDTVTVRILDEFMILESGYLHEGCPNKSAYPHDSHANKNSYPHNGLADKDSNLYNTWWNICWIDLSYILCISQEPRFTICKRFSIHLTEFLFSFFFFSTGCKMKLWHTVDYAFLHHNANI